MDIALVRQYGAQVLHVCHTNTYDHRRGKLNGEPAVYIESWKLAEVGYLANKGLTRITSAATKTCFKNL